MTSLISSVFEMALARAADFDEITVLLLDEADALASSRETPQMHHEDRAGVNALIQGVGRIAAARKPVLVVFCTNRPGSLDPAIRRRAADIFKFTRPTDEQRRTLLEAILEDLDLDEKDLAELVDSTGPSNGRGYGFTFSDIHTRLVPNAVREAYGQDVSLTG
ncbi:MAG: AAA family ATPase [Candidatus Palauibacterales bacterium]|nr:AAA family ATPase [Candidatus Palauibacterales bacterium]